MLLPPALVIFLLVFSVGKCQFFYNYEEADVSDSPQGLDESPLNQYNSPSSVNQQSQQEVKQRDSSQYEVENAGRSANQGNSDISAFQAPSEFIDESNTPRMQRPRKRMYRRVFREGNYVQPIQPPKTYAPSVFENIGLGEAPSGVYVPQDSFLNVLRNNQQSYYRNENPSAYYQNNAPGQSFFVQPPLENERRPRNPSVLPNVQYIPRSVDSPSRVSSGFYNSGSDGELSIPQGTQSSERLRQRQQVQPIVDIDVLRTPPDIMRPTKAIPIQGMRGNQGRSVAPNRNRQTLLIENYKNSNQPPRTYSPSVFQNIGLGEAPQGVDIPADSLLNVLRNPSSYSRTSPRTVNENVQFSPQPQEPSIAEEMYSQPVISERTISTYPDTRRRSRQRSVNSNAARRTVRRRTEYQYDDETQDSMQSVPATSQQQRRQSTRNDEPRQSRRYASSPSVNQPPQRRQPARAESQQPQDSDRRQRKHKPARLAIAALPEDTDDDGIPGEAGVDHPTFHTIPQTTFSCREQQHNGYYADLETSCQVVHLCQAGGVKSSFLCPNGTIFSQEKFSCQWWYKVNCADSPNFYSINDSLYKVPEDTRRKAKE